MIPTVLQETTHLVSVRAQIGCRLCPQQLPYNHCCQSRDLARDTFRDSHGAPSAFGAAVIAFFRGTTVTASVAEDLTALINARSMWEDMQAALTARRAG